MIFSDESRFSLDGPNARVSYWADTRVARRWQGKRQKGGGICMIWAAFSLIGKTSLVFVTGSINSVGYTELLEENLLPVADEHSVPPTFQQ